MTESPRSRLNIAKYQILSAIALAYIFLLPTFSEVKAQVPDLCNSILTCSLFKNWPVIGFDVSKLSGNKFDGSLLVGGNTANCSVGDLDRLANLSEENATETLFRTSEDYLTIELCGNSIPVSQFGLMLDTLASGTGYSPQVNTAIPTPVIDKVVSTPAIIEQPFQPLQQIVPTSTNIPIPPNGDFVKPWGSDDNFDSWYWKNVREAGMRLVELVGGVALVLMIGAAFKTEGNNSEDRYVEKRGQSNDGRVRMIVKDTVGTGNPKVELVSQLEFKRLRDSGNLTFFPSLNAFGPNQEIVGLGRPAEYQRSMRIGVQTHGGEFMGVGLVPSDNPTDIIVDEGDHAVVKAELQLERSLKEIAGLKRLLAGVAKKVNNVNFLKSGTQHQGITIDQFEQLDNAIKEGTVSKAYLEADLEEFKKLLGPFNAGKVGGDIHLPGDPEVYYRKTPNGTLFKKSKK